MKRTRVLVVSAGFLPAESHGGVPYSTFNISRQLAHDPQMELKVVTTDRNGPYRLNVPLDRWTSYGGLPVVYCSTWRGSYTYAPQMAGHLSEAVQWADVVISSSTLWDCSGFLTARFCARERKPHLVYPRGLLDGWALHHKQPKKQLGLLIQGRRILRQASCIVALSAAEEASIRALGIHTPVAVIPNGEPAVPSFDDEVGTAQDRAGLPDSPYLLFLGRISKKKGLDQTLAAFRQVLERQGDAVLVIAGPVEPGYAQEFGQLCSGFDSRNLRVLEPVSGLRKHLLLKSATGFILTSASEGVPMAALEAMQYGLPVILTPECNVAGIDEKQAGWLVPFGDITATAAAQLALLNDAAERARRGAHARSLAQADYAWEEIGRQTRSLIFEQLGSVA